jgi:hypothetical protein
MKSEPCQDDGMKLILDFEMLKDTSIWMHSQQKGYDGSCLSCPKCLELLLQRPLPWSSTLSALEPIYKYILPINGVNPLAELSLSTDPPFFRDCWVPWQWYRYPYPPESLLSAPGNVRSLNGALWVHYHDFSNNVNKSPHSCGIFDLFLCLEDKPLSFLTFSFKSVIAPWLDSHSDWGGERCG